jgi:hypothetical protein
MKEDNQRRCLSAALSQNCESKQLVFQIGLEFNNAYDESYLEWMLTKKKSDKERNAQ